MIASDYYFLLNKVISCPSKIKINEPNQTTFHRNSKVRNNFSEVPILLSWLICIFFAFDVYLLLFFIWTYSICGKTLTLNSMSNKKVSARSLYPISNSTVLYISNTGCHVYHFQQKQFCFFLPNQARSIP